MRDYVKESKQLPLTSYLHSKCPEGYPRVYSTHVQSYVAEEKGREDIQVGPKPFPTNYWAYTLENEPSEWGFGESAPSLRYNSSCRYHHVWIERPFVSAVPFHIYQYGIRPYSEVHDGVGVTAWIADNPHHANEAVRKAMLSLDGTNLGQALGEMPKTASSFTDALTRLARAIAAFRRGNFSQCARLLGLHRIPELAKNWLSWIWGFKPYLDAVQKGGEDLKRALEQPDLVKFEGTDVSKSVPAPLPDWTVGGNITRGASAQLNYKLSDQYLQALNRVGLINPLSLAWELIPLSFIVNWIISIGDFLKLLSHGVGLDYSHGHVTSFTKGIMVATGSGGLTNYQNNKRPCIWTLRRNVVSRDVLPVAPIPTIHMKWSLDFNKVANLIVLLLSRR